MSVPSTSVPAYRHISPLSRSIPWDDAFNNRIEVEEADLADNKMSYYSSQEMGKATGEQDGMGN